jgi:hypothetical protein
MMAQFKSNHRLSWAFKVCKDLGIDDPVYWMNNTDASVLDAWIAYSQYENELESGAGEESPEKALEILKGL